MKSFVTGSRAYGFPREDSDIDLVVLVDPDDLVMLANLSDEEKDLESPGGVHYEDGCSLRFGKLNLLCVTTEKHFETWRQGTNELKAKAPVTRDEAVAHLANLRSLNDVSGW